MGGLGTRACERSPGILIRGASVSLVVLAALLQNTSALPEVIKLGERSTLLEAFVYLAIFPLHSFSHKLITLKHSFSLHNPFHIFCHTHAHIRHTLILTPSRDVFSQISSILDKNSCIYIWEQRNINRKQQCYKMMKQCQGDDWLVLQTSIN